MNLIYSCIQKAPHMISRFNSFKIFLSFCLIIQVSLGWGQVTEGFESTTPPPAGWTYNSVTHGTNNPRTGSRCATFNASGDYIISPLQANPNVISFYYRRSGTAPTSPSFTVAYSSSTSGPWTTIPTSSPFNASPANPITSFTTTYQQFTATVSSLSNVYFRVIDGRSSGGNELYIDDFSITAAAVPSITLADNGTQVTSANVVQGTTNHILHKFSLAVATANATLTGVQVTSAGTYASADLTNLKVRYSTDATLDGSDATLSTYTSVPTAGTLTFPSFTSQTINSGNTGYIFITADIDAGATVNNTISVNAVTTAQLTFSSGTKSGSTTSGGTQTITSSGAPNVSIDNTGAPATGNIAFNTNDVVIGGFRLSPSATVDFTAVNVATSGTATTTDISNFRLIYDADNSGTYNGGDAVVATVSTLANPLAFSGFTQTFSSARRYLIIADIASTATDGRTITTSISSAANVTTTGTESGMATGNTQTIQATEIRVEGNSTEIVDGDVTPTTADHTNFGNVEVGQTLIRTFTIRNIGNQTLNLSGSPIVAISGSSQFMVTTQPSSSSISGPSGLVTFQVTYTPTTYNAQTATISITNNDGNENPYNFDISGTGTTSTNSDIIANATYTYNQNINYLSFQAPTITNTSHSVDFLRFDIRDGGGATDLDNLPTILSTITFNVTNLAQIRSAALFNGNTMVNNAPTINVGAGTITFSGLSGANVTANDGSTNSLTLRASFLTSVTDNTQFQVTISNANVSAAGSNTSSLFSSFTSVVSSTTGDRNRIEVTADRLAFSQQPSNTNISGTMTPAPAVRAVDLNNNTDLDYSGSISITSSGTMTGSPLSASASSGVATFSSVVHTVVGTGLSLSASASGLTGIGSNTFNITTIAYVNGDYRTTGSGNWVSNNATPAIWERLVSGTWTTSNSPAFNTSNTVYVQSGHTITTGGSFGSSVNLHIFDGGVFNCNHSSTTANTKVYSGGTLNVNASFTMASGGTFEVEDNGTVNLNFSFGTPASSIWQGTEIFHPNSNLVIQNWDFANDFLIPDNTSISTNTFNGYTAVFGNVTVDAGSNTTTWIMLASGTSINLAHGDLSFLSNTGNINIATTGTVTTGIGGDFYVDDAYTGTNLIQLKTSGTMNFTVKGNMQLDAATVRVHAGSATGASTILNIDGDLTITPSAVLDFNSSVSANATATVNLKGDLTGQGSGLLQNTNSSSLGNFNFTGTGDGLTDSTTQTIDIASTSSNENRNINFNINSGAYVRLINRDFELGANSGVYVQSGGTFDFGFNGTTPLNVTISGSQTGTVFQSLQSSTLKITSTDGISTTGSIGNVRTVASNRSFNQTATFHYIGKANQVTGNGITTGSTGRVIICDLIDNNTQLSFTNSTGITNNTTVSATGGKLDIRKGQVIESTTAFISGSTGTLYMSPGTLYQIAKGSASATDAYADLIPRVVGATYPYILNGGTIELTGSGSSDAFQVLRGSVSRPNYVNVKFSGANTLGTDYKALSSQSTIDSALIITGSTVVDCITSNGSAASFVGNGGLIMDGGRLRIKKLNDANPELAGIAIDYNLSGGTIEFYGSSNVQQQKIRGSNGSPVKTIQYFDLEINADAGNYTSGSTGGNVDLNQSFTLKGTMNVNSPAVLRMDASDFIYKFNGNTTNNVNINAGAGLYYGSPNGITTVAQGGTGLDPDFGASNPAAGNIRTNIRNFSSSASYGFVSSSTMASGSGLPSNIVSLYINRNNSGELVNLTNSVTLTDTLKFQNAGIVVTGVSNTIFVDNASVDAVKGGSVSGTDKYVQGRLQRKINSGSTYSFPIGHSAQNAQGFSITPTGTNGSNILGFLEANSSSPLQARAYCDLETKTASGQQIGQGTAGADGALDLVTFNLASPLQWDVTNPGGGITAYDITVNANGGQDINPVSSAGGTPIRYLMKNGEPGNTGVTTGTGGADYPSTGFLACPNGYTLTGMTSFSDFTLDGASQSNTGLPVKLTYFTARKEGETSVLNWMTSLEIDNDRFEVERKVNEDFEYIGKVNGSGNSTSPIRYQFVDEAPANAWNYYRLKQVDFDGKFEYSNIVALYFDNKEEVSVSFYPNPVDNNIFISVNNKNVIQEAAIYNALGQEIRRIDIDSNNDVSDLASGTYFIKVKTGLQIITKQFVKF